MDKQGHLHLAYGEDNLHYLRSLNFPDGLAWLIENLNTTTKVNGFAALALDNVDHPHICYHTDGCMVYTHHNGKEWIFKTIDDSTHVGTSISIALDSKEDVHISYYDCNQGYLKYASCKNNEWFIEVVDDSQNVGIINSLAIDSEGCIYIAYLGLVKS